MDAVTEPLAHVRPRHERKQKHRLRITLISIGSVVAVLLAGAGVYAFSISQTFNNVQKIDDVFPDDSVRPPVVKTEGSAPQNILLLGSDTRGKLGTSIEEIKGTRSDTMMVVHIPADRENIQVMSFMRDFWVEIPGHGEAKLNAAMAWGGIPLLVQTLEGLIDSRIDHVAIVDFQGFKGITDALGGVTVDNPKAFTGTELKGHRFEKGLITLHGEEALGFVRERHAFADGDYTRVRNQQLFIKAVMGEVLSAETLTNPLTISNLVGNVAPFMAVDAGLNASYAATLGFELRGIRVGDVRFFTIPTLGTGTERGQSIVKVDWGELEKIKAAFKADELDKYTLPVKP